MPDEINKKVIDLFSNSKKVNICHIGEVCKDSEGYEFVTIEKGSNGRHFTEADLLERANSCYYIVKVMVKGGISPIINNFKIPGSKIIDFIIEHNQSNKDKIIEIDKFYPEEWA